uniref:Zinc transporter ZIP10 n=1 Tax=Panagrellus redivivus TaxID=6233 RepID=A0A7E4V752_PANRE
MNSLVSSKVWHLLLCIAEVAAISISILSPLIVATFFSIVKARQSLSMTMKNPPTSSLMMDEQASAGDLQSFYTQASFYRQNKYERQFVLDAIADEVACLSVECKLLADRVDCESNDRHIPDELNKRRRNLAELFVKQIVLTQEDVPVVLRSATTSVTKMLGASSTESLDTIREVESELERSIGSGATFASAVGSSSHGSIGSGTTVLPPSIGHGTIPGVKQEVHGVIDPEDVIASLHLPEGAVIKTKEVVILNGHQVDGSEHTLVNHEHSGHHLEHSGHQQPEHHEHHHEHGHHHEHSGHHHEHSGHHHEHSEHGHEHGHKHEHSGHGHEHSGHHHEHSEHRHEHGHHHEHSGHHHDKSEHHGHSGGILGLTETTHSSSHGQHHLVGGSPGLSLHSSDSHRTASAEAVVTTRSSSTATAQHTVTSANSGYQTVSGGGNIQATSGTVSRTTHHIDGHSSHGHHGHHDAHHHHHITDELDHRLHEHHEHSHLDGIIHDGELPRRDDYFELISTVVTDWQVNKHGHITDMTLDVELQIASLGVVEAIVPLSYLDIVNIETLKLEPEWKVFDEVTVINTVEYEYEEKVKGPPKITTIEETEVDTKVTTDVETEKRKWRLEEEERLEKERLRREEETRIAAERRKQREEEEARAELERRKWREEEEARIEAERRKRREEEEARIEAERLRREEEARLAASRRAATTSVREEVKVETITRTAVSDDFKANRNLFENMAKETGPSSPIEYQNRYTNRRQYAPASHHRPHAAEYKVVGSYVNTKETVYKPTNRGVDETPILGQNATAGSKSYWTSASSQSNVAEFDRLSNAKYELKQTTVEPPTSRQIGVFSAKKTTLFDDDKNVDDTHELFRAKAFAHRRQELQADEQPAAPVSRTSGSLSSQHFVSTGGSTGRLSTESSESSKVNGVGTKTNGSTIYSVMKKTSSTSNGNPFESDGYVSQYSNKGANYSFTAGTPTTEKQSVITESSHTTETHVQHSSSGEQLQRTGGKYVIEHDSPAIRSYRINVDK